MATDYDSIESFDAAARRRAASLAMPGDAVLSFKDIQQHSPKLSKSSNSIDTIASAQPAIKHAPRMEIDTEPENKSKGSSFFSFSGIVDLGKKAWDILCTPITFGGGSASGKANKSGGDSVGGIGSPNLEPPFQIDQEEFQKLLKEMKQLIHQIKETTNEFEDEIREKERFKQSQDMLIAYMKTQAAIREDGALLLQFQIVFHHKRDLQLRKEFGDADKLNMETKANIIFWSRINKAITAATVVATLAAACFAVYATAGTALAVIPAAMQITLATSQSLLGVSSGASELIGVHFEKKFGEQKQITVVLRERHVQVFFLEKRDLEQMQEGWNQSLKVREWMIQILKNSREATQSINST